MHEYRLFFSRGNLRPTWRMQWVGGFFPGRNTGRT